MYFILYLIVFVFVVR